MVNALRSCFPTSLLLDIVGLSSSSFYYQLKALNGPSQYANLTKVVTEIVEHSGFSYGYRRVWIQLKKLGIKVSEKVVRRIISAEGLTVRYMKKRRRYSSYRGEISDAPPNLVKRNFHAEAPGLLWLTDISEFPADDGKIYFSALVDCFDGKIVEATTSRHPNQQLADDCLKQAFENNAPPDPAQLVIHSDRGCHYRGNSWIQASQDIGFTRSMSKKGCSPDNSACEGLFGRMKNEMFYGRRWPHCDELERAIHEYVDFYNEHRITLEFDGLSINQRRRELLL
ncbi:IS3 family transposase [Corynebacterium diphtheriae]|nr:IS3 family transposase [Corynebacterium diphtheriae]CAB0908204.1 IS3 family transposase [Corynebacterium diphtheriae]CAB0954678.1 IS3 family transposase [Corynebacterium diphtheriae]CAB0957953.1 IS3 family transposase [Corynebacterium diphtheriae]CAB0997693.1 IS3 family transposase [Corynebacterium diphtheriae]